MADQRQCAGRLQEFQVIGRHLPTENNPTPKLYRMRIFAPNAIVAKSRFWYFLAKLRKVKKANGEIVSLNIVCSRRSLPISKPFLETQRSCVAEEGTDTISDSREATHQGEELRYLDPLRFSVRHTQYVQGVPRNVAHRCRTCALPGYGCTPSCPFPNYPHLEGRRN